MKLSSSSNTAQWACPKCTFYNAFEMQRCEMCQFEKQNTVQKTTTTLSSAINGIGQSVNGFLDKVAAKINIANNNNNNVLRTSSSSGQIVMQSANVWACPRCTFSQNPIWSRVCDACSYDPADFLENSVIQPAQPQVVPAQPPKLPPRPRDLGSSASASSSSTTTNKPSTKNDQIPDSSPQLAPTGFLIEDYDTQLHKTLAEWQSIVAINASRQFFDPAFQPCLDSIFYDANRPASESNLFDQGQGSLKVDVSKIQWTRPYHHHHHNSSRHDASWTVFRSPMPSDIHQGVLGNCWLVSALSLIAFEPLLLHKIFVTPDFQPSGAYCLRLCIDGRWRVIIVDDLLPSYGSHGRLLFSKATRNQLWVPLIEKAMAKSYGCYEALAGGHSYEGLSALTGEAVETFILPEDADSHCPASPKDTSDPEDLWIKLVSYLDARFLIGASCGRESTSEEVYNSVGLIKNHAYAVLAVHSSVNPSDGKPLRLVKLRNPWGTSEWRGDWCDASPTWRLECPNDVKNQLAPYGQPEGVFWMSYRDFLFYFENLDVCKVRPDWREYRITARFLRPPSETMVVALLTVVETSQVELMLHQHGLRQKSKRNRSPVDLFMLLCKVHRVGSQMVPGSVVGTSGARRLDAFSQAGEFLLQPGEYAVCVLSCHAACLAECASRTYTLSVHAAKPLVVDPILLPRTFLVDTLINYVREHGKKYYGPGEVVVSYVTERFSGLALLVDNGSSSWQVKVDCNCDGSENVVSTRGVLRSVDHLPPNTCQLVQLLTPLEPRQRWHVMHHLKHVATQVQSSGGGGNNGISGLFRIGNSHHQNNHNNYASNVASSEPPIPEDLRWLHAARPILKSP